MNIVPDYAVIDVETTEIADGEIPRTKFWGYADSKGYKRFETTKAFLRFLKSEPTKTLLHHANFDILQILVDGGRLQILRSHNGKLIRCKIGKHTTVNTYSCFPVSLASIFEAFGHKKKSLKDLDARNYDDCVLGLKCFLELDQLFQELAFVSPLIRGTVASTSFHAAEKFVGKKMPADSRFLESYRGGRVEVFDLREQQAQKYDINSSYPFSILDCPMDGELWKVKIKTGDYYCPLFVAGETDTLLFPNGTFTSYVWRDVWERYIVPNMASNTHIKILSKHKVNFRWLHRLKDFIRILYEKKQSCSGAINVVCKFLLNAMYGRIGLRGDSEKAEILDYRPDGENVTAYRLGPKCWLVFRLIVREATRSNFPFASYITDNARGRLYSAFVQSSALYGDTDSVISPRKFSARMGTDCGDWKWEGENLFRAINVKDYLWGEEAVRKGGDQYTKWTLKQFASGQPAEKVTRERRTELRKRRVLPDGTTEPLIVQN